MCIKKYIYIYVCKYLSYAHCLNILKVLKWYLHLHRKKRVSQTRTCRHETFQPPKWGIITHWTTKLQIPTGRKTKCVVILDPHPNHSENMEHENEQNNPWKKMTWKFKCRTTCRISPFGMLNSHLRGELKRSLFDTANTSRLCLHWDHIETKPSELHKIAAQMTKDWSLLLETFNFFYQKWIPTKNCRCKIVSTHSWWQLMRTSRQGPLKIKRNNHHVEGNTSSTAQKSASIWSMCIALIKWSHGCET